MSANSGRVRTDKPTVWVADDDEASRSFVAEYLAARNYAVTCFDSGEPVVSRVQSFESPSLLILDIRMPRVDGLEVLEEMEKLGMQVPTIVLSGLDHTSTVVKAIRLGACDYLVKPLEESELAYAIEKVFERRTEDGENGDGASFVPSASFHTSNQRMLQIRAISEQVAQSDVPILILGESGVGKEVLARHVHARSGRVGPFVKVNCAALPADLLESELYGYERGAFTGAQREKPGKFELACKGTIMLDEIGEMSPTLQAKLLHVLQDGEYARVGGTRNLTSDARIISATNQSLDKITQTGGFREDLFFRLNVITIEVPPLRERPEDIVTLCSGFVNRYRTKYKSAVKELPPELLAAFAQYHWPGNVRQLENHVRRFLILPDVKMALMELQRGKFLPDSSQTSSLKEQSARAAENAEKELVLRTLKEVNWNRKQAARQLDICYKSLLNKLHRWALRDQADVADGAVEGDISPAAVAGSKSRSLAGSGKAS